MLLKRKKVKRNIEDEIRRLYFAQIKRLNSPNRGEFIAPTTSATKTTAVNLTRLMASPNFQVQVDYSSFFMRRAQI
jgi:hypothetical protein